MLHLIDLNNNKNKQTPNQTSQKTPQTQNKQKNPSNPYKSQIPNIGSLQ